MKSCPLCDRIMNLSQNPLLIAEIGSSAVILHPNQMFKGRTLILYKNHVTELYHLKPEDRQQYFEEMVRVAEALDRSFHPDKMNYFIFGNVAAHLHWHIIPRYKDDPSWGGPVDFHLKKKLKDEEYEELIYKVRRNL